MELIDKIKDVLVNVKKPDELPDDFNPSEWSGGNFDDAYSLGEDHGSDWGAYSLAEKLLEIINKEKNNV